MGRFLDWEKEKDNTGKTGQGGDGNFLRLKAGNKYKVRLVGKFFCYKQHWTPVICRSPGADKDGNVIDPIMISTGAVPKDRFAVWVIDREDADKLKIMDFPPSLMDQFKAWGQAMNEVPGGVNGPDWQINIQAGPGGDIKKQKYVAMALDKKPFSAEQVASFKEQKLAEKLAEARRDNTPEEIRAMIAQKNAGGGHAAGQAGQQAGPTGSAPATPPAAPATPAKNDGMDF